MAHPLIHKLIFKIYRFFFSISCLAGVKLPPKPVATRWGTWFTAVEFFNEPEHKQTVISAMNDLVYRDKSIAPKATELLQLLHNSQVNADIETITEHYCDFKYAIKNLEYHKTRLPETVTIVEDLRQTLEEKTFESEKDNDILAEVKKKFDDTIANNKGYVAARKLIEDDTPTGNFVNMNQEERKLSLNSDGTSDEAERSFSIYNSMLRKNRTSFEPENFRYHVITKIYKRRKLVLKDGTKVTFQLTFFQFVKHKIIFLSFTS